MFLALVALYEVADEAGRAPVRPSFALRFALAFLYTNSNGDRSSYDGFWRQCQHPYDGRTQANYARGTMTRTAWNGICHSLGVALSIDFMEQIHSACRSRKEGQRLGARTESGIAPTETTGSAPTRGLGGTAPVPRR
jgi:hypothetical protein